jgi:GAF domain-containing protein
MVAAPIPANDAERLQALRELLILDTPPEQRFDRLVAFAQAEFEVETVLISLVDENRQWFKAKQGLADCEMARDISFCGHAILQSEILLIEDARLDPRFADNPLVLGPPHVRFYAGAPLEPKPGLRIGTLCMLDPRPRRLDVADLAILGSLRDLVQAELLGQRPLES